MELDPLTMFATEDQEIHYVYENNGFILDSNCFANDWGNVDGGDGALLLNGAYLLTEDGHTILLPSAENGVQYLVNDDSEAKSVENGVPRPAELFQIVEDEPETSSIVYYTEDESGSRELTEEEMSQIAIMQLDENCINVESFALDSGLSGQLYTAFQPEVEAPTQQSEIMDVSKITGRNLITGQVVSLDTYFEKMKRNAARSENVKKSTLKNMVDERKTSEKCGNGKKFIAKIVEIKRKELESKDVVQIAEIKKKQQESEVVVAESEDEPPEPKPDAPQSNLVNDRQILLDDSASDQESLENISKTLVSIMEMESVRKKLENMNIFIKLVQKMYNTQRGIYVKTVAYSYGYMEKVLVEDATRPPWNFIACKMTDWKYLCTTNLTILIAYNKAGKKSVRVNLNSASSASQNLCPICLKRCHNSVQLQGHIRAEHTNSACALCRTKCEDPESQEALKIHREQHVHQGQLLCCPLCVRTFTTNAKLEKHVKTHGKIEDEETRKKFQCPLCDRAFRYEHELNFHKRSHQNDKHFACNICMRTFSRQSNLYRHMVIHKGASYKCEICSCSYNFMSSLTRHMVQVHMAFAI